MISQAAYFLRDATGTSKVEKTARRAVEILADYDIPHVIVGGVAVQEHGYERVTVDVDIVVPDPIEAMEVLTANLTGPFRRVAGLEGRVEDSLNGVPVDLLPGGGRLRPGCKVPFPKPGLVLHQPIIAKLPEILSLKLDSWRNSPLRRSRDRTDVIELIIRGNLPRELEIHPAVRELYLEIWDGLQTEPA